MSNSYSNTPTRRIARLSLGPRSRYLKNRPIVSTDSISSAWISSIDTSSSATSSAVIYQGKKTFEWRDRVILKLGSKGGWPVDHYELERQEAEHHLLRMLLGYPYIGPVNEILTHQSSSSRPKILDIGTGTGIWVIEMADLFPHAEVIGVEEIAIQPEWIPPNCEVDVWDLTKPLPYKSSSFDIIHIRSLQNRITSYTALITQVFDLLKPGGLLMIFEDFTLLPQPQSATAQTDVIPDKKVKAFFDAYKRSFKYNGMKQNSLEDVINTFRDFRGCEVKGDLIKVPIGHGSGKTTQLSKIHLINLKAWIESTRYMIVHSGGYTDDEFDLLSEALIEQIEKEELYTFYHSFSIRKA